MICQIICQLIDENFDTATEMNALPQSAQRMILKYKRIQD